MKMIYAKNPEEGEKILSEKDKTKIETAIIKYYFEKLYKVKGMEIVGTILDGRLYFG